MDQNAGHWEAGWKQNPHKWAGYGIFCIYKTNKISNDEIRYPLDMLMGLLKLRSTYWVSLKVWVSENCQADFACDQLSDQLERHMASYLGHNKCVRKLSRYLVIENCLSSCTL